VKSIIVLLAACAGAAGFFWLRGGGDLGQMKGAAKNALNHAEDEIAAMDGRDAPYEPARAASA
jgi:hypothetical protein